MNPVRLTDSDWHAIAENRAKAKMSRVTGTVLLSSIIGVAIMMTPSIISGDERVPWLSNLFCIVGLFTFAGTAIRLGFMIKTEHGKIYQKVKTPQFVPTDSDWKSVAMNRTAKIGRKAIVIVGLGVAGWIISILPFFFMGENTPDRANYITAGLCLLLLLLGFVFAVRVLFVLVEGRKLAKEYVRENNIKRTLIDKKERIVKDDDGEI